METSLMVDDYPEPKEQKCFVVSCECHCTTYFYVYADNQEQAEEIARGNEININREHEEIEDLTIDEITGIEEC